MDLDGGNVIELKYLNRTNKEALETQMLIGLIILTQT